MSSRLLAYCTTWSGERATQRLARRVTLTLTLVVMCRQPARRITSHTQLLHPNTPPRVPTNTMTRTARQIRIMIFFCKRKTERQFSYRAWIGHVGDGIRVGGGDLTLALWRADASRAHRSGWRPYRDGPLPDALFRQTRQPAYPRERSRGQRGILRSWSSSAKENRIHFEH